MTGGQEGGSGRKDSHSEKMNFSSREIEAAEALVELQQLRVSEPSLPFIGASESNTTHENHVFRKAVQDTFKEEREKVEKIWELMEGFEHRRIDLEEMVTKVKGLFRGHRVLILGFNTFLPKRYQIALPNQKMEHSQARSFLDKVKARFQSDEVMYRTFMDKAKMLATGKSIKEIYQEVAHLLNADHPDLVEEFSYFLPAYIGAVLPGLNEKPLSRVAVESTREFEERQLLLCGRKETDEEKIVRTSEDRQVEKPNTTSETRGKERVWDDTEDNSLPSSNFPSESTKEDGD